MATIVNPDNSSESFIGQVKSNGYDSIMIRATLETSSGSSGTVATRYVYLELEQDGELVAESWIESAQTSGSVFYFPGPAASNYAYVSGLDPGTEYSWTLTVAWGMDDSSLSSWAVLSGTVTTDEKEIILEPWTWEASNGEATWQMTQNAYAILMGEIPVDGRLSGDDFIDTPYGFSHYVWNDFVNKVLAMRLVHPDANGEWTVVGGYLDSDQCMVSAGDTLSAEIYNSVKVQIGELGDGTGIYDVVSGGSLTGYHIIQIAKKLNDLISGL